MHEDIQQMADVLGLSYDKTLEKLKENYDGYHFAWPSSDIFNPYSLLTCFSKRKVDSYWFGSGTPTYLLNMMRKYDFTPIDLGEQMDASKDDFDAATETMTTIMPLLYQSGYITIKNYDPETELYTLALPNKEVRIGLFRSMLPHYLAAKSAMCNTTVAKMSALINKGNMDGALQLLKTFWETVPYCDNTDYEGHYQQTMYIIFALLTNFRILVEQHTFRGRTDITMTLGTFPWIKPKPGSMGKPNPQYDVHILRPDMTECEDGEKGEICIRIGDNKPIGLFKYYYRDEKQTKSVWHDGYYHTGDMAWRDEEGYFWFEGRIDDVIKSSGYRIGPFEVENALMTHPAVVECAITGVPDPIRGMVVKATVVLKDEYKSMAGPDLIKKLQDHVKHETAPYKYPRIIEFVDELPKTISGKIRRVEIREKDNKKK